MSAQSERRKCKGKKIMLACAKVNANSISVLSWAPRYLHCWSNTLALLSMQVSHYSSENTRIMYVLGKLCSLTPLVKVRWVGGLAGGGVRKQESTHGDSQKRTRTSNWVIAIRIHLTGIFACIHPRTVWAVDISVGQIKIWFLVLVDPNGRKSSLKIKFCTFSYSFLTCKKDEF